MNVIDRVPRYLGYCHTWKYPVLHAAVPNGDISSSIKDCADESTIFCTTLGSGTSPTTERACRSMDASANPERRWCSSGGDTESERNIKHQRRGKEARRGG